MKKLVIVLIGLILVFSFVSASFEIGNPSHLIEKQYSSSDRIKGWINISLNNEPVDSLFKDSFGNLISLIDLLKVNSNATYSCNTGGCLPNYEASNPEQTKTFSLNSGTKKIIGFQITENIANINSVTFNVESDATESCSNQLEIDFLNDNSIDVKNNKLSTSSCSSSKSYGCFTSQTTSLAKIDSQSYCQRITLSESPGFKIGAWVKEGVAGSMKLSMSLYNMDRDYLVSCDLPTASSSGGEIDCNANYPTKKSGEYYVCISSSGSGGEYYIRGYSSANGCGYKGYPSTPSSENYAYQIFAEGKKFSAIGILGISNVLPGGNTISKIAEDYIGIRYNGSSCSSGCVIPIKFTSKMDQNLILKSLSVNYDIGGGLLGYTDKFYDLIESPSTVTSKFQKINLDKGNFSVSSSYGEKTFDLNLDGKEVFSEEIIIKKAPSIQGLNPRITAAAVPTEFKILVSSNVSNYNWNFGDGTNTTTTTNKVTHTYNATGTYDLKITITDNNQISSSMTFKIDVSSPKQAINTTLEKKSEDLSNIDLQMKQSEFEQNLKLALNFETLDNDLNKIQQDYKKASSEEDYKKIMTSLLGIEVPESIDIIESAKLITFYPEKNKINLGVIKKIAGGDYDIRYTDEYAGALLSWNQKNMETKVTFNKFSANYGEFDERSILRTFEFQINKKNNLDNSYLIIADLDGIQFEKDYSMREESGYLYIELEQDSEIISFTTTEDVSFIDVPVFISPELEKLKIAESIDVGEEEKSSKWILFIFILFFLAIAGVVVYVILQEWYKRKYENYLFKNRNDLYNLMIYITEEKKKDLTDKEIYSKLKKSGWSSEQINYVLRKHSGKRTGMFEIISLGKKKVGAQQLNSGQKMPLTKKP